MMKKLVHKNQIIITALAVMIVVAGYLNFTGQEITTGGFGKSDKAKTERNSPAPNATANAQATEKTTAKSKEGTDREQTADISEEDSKDAGKSKVKVSDSGEVVASEENPGEAVMVSNVIAADYFTSAKLSREQTRAKNKETLMEIVNNSALSSADKKAAVQEVAKITENSTKESDAELLLEAKGFPDAMVSFSDGKADVVVRADNLTAKQMAQVVDIVKRKLGISADNIVITPVSVEK